jgi:hypothetical protein
MNRDVWSVSLLLVLLLPITIFAQDETEAISSYTGITWGMTRTFWHGANASEGYAQAGTAGPVFGLRKVQMMGARTALVPYLTFMAMYSGPVTTMRYVQDSILVSRETRRSYFREIDLGLNLQFYPLHGNKSFYFGLGPSIRWGQSGTRLNDGQTKSGKAAWFGLTGLLGYQAGWGKTTAVFVEPQFTFSPDPADRWQQTYPPDNLNLHMGILF